MSDHHDEQTLTKVYAGLEAAGITGQDAIDAVNQMQNEGILFRERDPRSTLRDAIVYALENTRVDSLVTVQHGGGAAQRHPAPAHPGGLRSG